jgi:thiol-disulfide isomerase/thioredoxin
MKKVLIVCWIVIFSVRNSANADKLPDFTLSTVEKNESFILSKEIQGKKVLINFWATWCTSCIQEIPLLENLKEKYKEDVHFIAINAGEKNHLVNRFFKKYKFSYIQLMDNDRTLSKALGVESLPVTIVIDQNLNILYRGVVPPKSL